MPPTKDMVQSQNQHPASKLLPPIVTSSMGTGGQVVTRNIN